MTMTQLNLDALADDEVVDLYLAVRNVVEADLTERDEPWLLIRPASQVETWLMEITRRAWPRRRRAVRNHRLRWRHYPKGIRR